MKKQNIRITAALLAVAAILASVLSAFAVDPDYSGDIDPETNEPVRQNTSSSGNRVALSDNMYYDWGSHDYVYTVEGSLIEVHASMADGMILTSAASVSTTGDSSVVIHLNGQELSGDFSDLREVGDYVVDLSSGGYSQRLLSFKIIGPSTNDIHTFIPPDSFYIVSATRDEENVYQGRYSLDMEAEGLYHVVCESSATDLIYTLDTTIDRTPPVVNFSGRIDRNQRVHSALSFSGLQTGDTVILLRDAKQVDVSISRDGTGKITDSGNYIMQVYDAAGNMNEYRFTIMMYFNTGSWIFFVLLFAVIIGVAAYIVIKRKKLKIG